MRLLILLSLTLMLVQTVPDLQHIGGPGLDAVYRRSGQCAGRILKGEKPSKMPVQEPSKLHLAVNLKTARALRLTLPPGVILADEVVE